MSADGDPEHFGLVRRHAAWLREWISANTGWRVDITAEYARLRKVPADLDDTSRPARDPKSGQAFTARRYVLLCLVLAELERADRQTTLGRIAEGIVARASADEALLRSGIAPDFTTADERRDLVHAIRFLVALQVLIQQDGDEQAYLSARGDVLYRVQRHCLAGMLSTTRSPSSIVSTSTSDRLRQLTEETVLESEEARNQSVRWSITRRLLDNPVVYRADLSEAEAAYLDTQRPAIVRRIEAATGLIGEVRAEGIAMLDDRLDLTDLGIPEEGTDGHIALLVAEFLAGCAKHQPGVPVSLANIAVHIARERLRVGSQWRRDAREEGSEDGLARTAVERLCGLGLARHTSAGVTPMPAIGRYRLGELKGGGSSAAEAVT